MNHLEWQDTNPAIEIDRIIISNLALLLVVVLVFGLMWFVYMLVGGIIGY